jgi:hypothetical protein
LKENTDYDSKATSKKKNVSIAKLEFSYPSRELAFRSRLLFHMTIYHVWRIPLKLSRRMIRTGKWTSRFALEILPECSTRIIFPVYSPALKFRNQ